MSSWGWIANSEPVRQQVPNARGRFIAEVIEMIQEFATNRFDLCCN